MINGLISVAFCQLVIIFFMIEVELTFLLAFKIRQKSKSTNKARHSDGDLNLPNKIEQNFKKNKILDCNFYEIESLRLGDSDLRWNDGLDLNLNFVH